MNKFFADKDTIKHRLNICKSCNHYFKLTGTCKLCGCFMRVKTTIARLNCPDKPPRWERVYSFSEVTIPDSIKEEVRNIWPDMAHGRFKDVETKFRAVDIYNTMTNSNISKRTSCTSCLSAIKEAFSRIINENK